mmetsp:Transcript_20252/g.56986  ORF Transcript_20252/g.56986 Transcript_20252/m.56986 type:complete len:285 (-) Transcript_20252:797-1651(-)
MARGALASSFGLTPSTLFSILWMSSRKRRRGPTGCSPSSPGGCCLPTPTPPWSRQGCREGRRPCSWRSWRKVESHAPGLRGDGTGGWAPAHPLSRGQAWLSNFRSLNTTLPLLGRRRHELLSRMIGLYNRAMFMWYAFACPFAQSSTESRRSFTLMASSVHFSGSGTYNSMTYSSSTQEKFLISSRGMAPSHAVSSTLASFIVGRGTSTFHASSWSKGIAACSPSCCWDGAARAGPLSKALATSLPSSLKPCNVRAPGPVASNAPRPMTQAGRPGHCRPAPSTG